MSVLDILIIPDKRLKYKSSIVEVFDENLHEIVKNMYDTLYSSGNGIGLAAPQVAIFKRIVVIDLKENGNSNPITFINPRIISSSNENAKNEEGCLSIPNQFAKIDRPEKCNVKFLDYDGNHKEIKLWREEHMLERTFRRRKDLIKNDFYDIQIDEYDGDEWLWDI